VPKVIRGTLDGNGNLSVSLPATDDPDLDVTGWTYTVTEHIADAGRPPFQIEVPYSATSLDLSTVAPAMSQPVAVQSALTRYDIGVTVASESAAAKKADLAAPTGAGLVGVQVGNASRTVADKLGESASIKDFGGIGDNATDNAAAFAQAEASAFNRIYLPVGTYYATSASYQLTKAYFGPGKIRLAALNAPGRFTQMMVAPAKGSGTEDTYYFSGDLSRIDAEYFVLGSSNTNVRKSLTEKYFESTTTPHFGYFTNYSGASGSDARIPLATSAGATSVVVNSAASLAAGPVLLYDRVTGASQSATISSIVGTTVNFSPGITSALAANSYIANSPRTIQQFRFTQLNHYGAGDAYCSTYRVNLGYARPAGQDHFFNTSTGGLLGGDINHSADGTYSTTFESSTHDNGYDVASIGFVQTFNRTNSTGAYGNVWLGTYFKSEGSAYCDAAHVVAGKWKRGLDTVNADFGANQAAVNLAAGQRIYFNGSSTPDALGYSMWGNVAGTAYARYDSTSGAIQFNGAKLSADGLHTTTAGYYDGPTTQFIGSGQYTPTWTNISNATTITGAECQYMRVGNVVTVSGQV